MKDTRGNIAVIFVLTLIPVLTALGCAVDYSSANSAYTKLQTCADAAVVAAVGKQGMTKTAADAQTAMSDWFYALCPSSASNMSRVTIDKVTPTATDVAGVRAATLTFKATRANDFLAIAGLPHTSIGGSAQAGSAKPTYIDIYALLDDSPSMGLASTSDGMTKLQGLTPKNCQFGCHETGKGAASPDNYTIAKNHSVEMRIDVLRDAWVNLITQARNVAGINIFRFATYTFDSSLNTVQNLTGSFTTALNSANGIDLMAVPTSGPGSTYTDNMLTNMVPNIPASGDGSDPASSKKYLILVTDGVQDMYNCSYLYCHQTRVVTSTSCDAFKNKGVQVAVIYTTYVPFNDPDGNYNNFVKPIASAIEPALQGCASPGLYFAATEASEIASAFNQIFQHVLASARLTN